METQKEKGVKKYYYSKTQYNRVKKAFQRGMRLHDSYGAVNRRTECSIDGKPYTECISSGTLPNDKDAVLVHEGEGELEVKSFSY